MEDLPPAYLVVLRGALGGVDAVTLGHRLGVPPESVRTLLRLAAAKLAASVGAPK